MTQLICACCRQPLPNSVVQERYDKHVAECGSCNNGFLCETGIRYSKALPENKRSEKQ